MAWELDDRKPIYPQLMDEIIKRIITGKYQVGDKLPSVRELAEEAAVNPNTMQKAFTELERFGLVTTKRGAGRTVTEDESMIAGKKESMAKKEIEYCIGSLLELGYTAEEIKEKIRKQLETV